MVRKLSFATVWEEHQRYVTSDLKAGRALSYCKLRSGEYEEAHAQRVNISSCFVLASAFTFAKGQNFSAIPTSASAKGLSSPNTHRRVSSLDICIRRL